MPGEFNLVTLDELNFRSQYEELKQAMGARVSMKPGVICGDGGFANKILTTSGLQVEVAGMPGTLGSDLGIVLAAAAFEKQRGHVLDTEKIVLSAVEAAKKTVGTFDIHTSTETHGAFCDCGHCKVAANNGASGLGRDEVVAMFETAANLALGDGDVRNFVLDRNHDEKAVVVNSGVDFTLPHWLKPDEISGLPESAYGQRFVLDPQAAGIRQQKILGTMGYSYEEIGKINQVAAEQQKLTNAALAKGLPVFGVNLDNSGNAVDFLGLVKQDGSIGF